MLTSKEKRFIKYWEEQRKGGRWGYFFLYIIVGTLIIGILSFVVLLFLLQLLLKPLMLWIVPFTSVALAGLLTVMSWQLNEMRFKKIIRREIEQGKLQDEGSR